MHLVACLQMRSGPEITENLAQVEVGMERAARYGVKLLTTPENTTFLGPSDQKVALSEALDGSTHRRLADLARLHRMYLLVGSVAERFDATHCYNTSLFFSPEGDLLAYYRKIHLFDIDIPGGPRFQESATIRPGNEVVVVPTALGRIGLSICYDLRFPLLYQKLVEKGAEILMVPSAFTLQTGKDHWHPLLRARAIESQCYLLAPAQEGPHDSGGLRHSYGHSLILDPWGTVLAECGEGPGLCLAEIDLARLQKIRRAIPVRQHQVPL